MTLPGADSPLLLCCNRPTESLSVGLSHDELLSTEARFQRNTDAGKSGWLFTNWAVNIQDGM